MRTWRAVALIALASSGCRTTEKAPAELRLELYNVQDLVVCAGDMGRCDIPDHPQGCAEFTKRARTGLPSTLWDLEDQGWAFVFQNGLLIVRATPEVQGLVRDYVAAERAKAAPPK
jgi:hypothetical protein